ncbi:2OG-Fe(II) oxygenase [bacterium]|jgi:hypothetical protein|nr:2OG-Fe(II) oxygenase [bacterium]
MILSLPPKIPNLGYFLISLKLPEEIKRSVINRHWLALDQAIQKETQRGGIIFEELYKVLQFTQIEFIISIRSSLEIPDEDGIWHDDGSRKLAFSLSLTLNPGEIKGGILEIRRRDQQSSFCPSHALPTPTFGTMIVFATGIYGFEHKINKVSQGERIIIAGWCT